jgi:hypothetical protein
LAISKRQNANRSFLIKCFISWEITESLSKGNRPSKRR